MQRSNPPLCAQTFSLNSGLLNVLVINAKDMSTSTSEFSVDVSMLYHDSILQCC